jgi:hypothetical protein
LPYAAVEKDEASYSARYFICIPPLLQRGAGGIWGSRAQGKRYKIPFNSLLQRGKVELQPPWAAHGFIGAFEALTQ